MKLKKEKECIFFCGRVIDVFGKGSLSGMCCDDWIEVVSISINV